jgi:hypothetical protein
METYIKDIKPLVALKVCKDNGLVLTGLDGQFAISLKLVHGILLLYEKAPRQHLTEAQHLVQCIAETIQYLCGDDDYETTCGLLGMLPLFKDQAQRLNNPVVADAFHKIMKLDKRAVFDAKKVIKFLKKLERALIIETVEG